MKYMFQYGTAASIYGTRSAVSIRRSDKGYWKQWSRHHIYPLNGMEWSSCIRQHSAWAVGFTRCMTWSIIK